MGPRPENWKETGWKPKYTELERVEAGILYRSWCFPACMEYACVLNQDESDVVTDRHTDGPLPLRERDLARLLNMHQQNVNRAVKGLVARGKLAIDENGLYCPNPAPPPLSIEERQLLPRAGGRRGRRGAAQPAAALPPPRRGVARRASGSSQI